MTSRRWGEMKAVLGALLEVPAAGRPAMLGQLCGSDLEMRAGVESLLALEKRADDVLSSRGAPGAALRAEPPMPAQIGAYRVRRR